MTERNGWISLTPEEEFVCCAVADDPAWHSSALSALYRRLHQEDAVRVCLENGVGSIAALSLAGAIGEESTPSALRHEAHRITQRQRLYMQELDRIAGILAGQGLLLVALKNAGIARAIFTENAGNPMGDIDLLVSPGTFMTARSLLVEAGYVPGNRSTIYNAGQEAVLAGGEEFTTELSDGSTLWVELQWRPVAGRWINESQEPAADQLLERSHPVEGSHVRVLEPNDNLLQVCLHTAKHSYVRAPGFRLHTDADRIIRRTSIDWDRFVRTVESLAVKTAVYFSLDLAKTLLRTPVPDSVLESLRPGFIRRRAIERMLLNVGLFRPDDRKWGRAGYLIFTALLYDDFRSLLRTAFPSRNVMQARSADSSTSWLPLLYIRRLLDLLWKRENT